MKDDLKRKGAEFWNENPCGGQWRSYRDYMDWVQRTEPYIYRVFDHYEWKEKHVLEVGCGQGSALNYLPRLGARVCGVDMSDDSIARAMAGAAELGHSERVMLCAGDAEHLPFNDNTFDAVICLGVLHHTVDTRGGIQELSRVLKTGGFAIVMMYRTGNPKWWMTRTLRQLSYLVDRIKGRKCVISGHLLKKRKEGMLQGTALLELFGVPILKAFSNGECEAMFTGFSRIAITNHQPGFERNCDIIRALEPFRKVFRLVDTSMKNRWGFYQVIEAYK